MNLRRRSCSSALRTAAAAAAVVLLAGCGSSDELEADPTTEQSAEPSDESTGEPTDEPTDAGAQVTGAGYSYAVPDGWENVIDDPKAAAADTFVRKTEPIDNFLTNINTVVTPAPGVDKLDLTSPDLAQLRKQLARSTKIQAGVLPQPIADTELDGFPAIGHRADSFEAEGRTLTLTQYLAVRDEVSYVITVTASASDAEAADAAVRSVVESWTWS